MNEDGKVPLQDVDIVRSLETTLTVLDHQLKGRIEVMRDLSARTSSCGLARNRLFESTEAISM